jgi:hypothetical protein
MWELLQQAQFVESNVALGYVFLGQKLLSEPLAISELQE